MGVLLVSIVFFNILDKFLDAVMSKYNTHYGTLTIQKQQFYINNLVGIVNAVICSIWVPVAAY